MNVDDPASKNANTQEGGLEPPCTGLTPRCPPRSSKADYGRELTHRGVPKECAVGKQGYCN